MTMRMDEGLEERVVEFDSGMRKDTTVNTEQGGSEARDMGDMSQRGDRSAIHETKRY